MTITSYPFENQDTTETQYSLLFREFQDSGVVGSIDGPGFSVTADGSGLDVQVNNGFAILRGHAVDSNGVETVVLDDAGNSPRIDRIVLRLEPAQDRVTLAVVKGTASSTPEAPELTQTATGVFEIPLARVAVAANALNISNANITDERQFSGGRVGVWRTNSRPSQPRRGRFGFNVTVGLFEFWDGVAWLSMGMGDVIEGYREKRVVLPTSGTVTLDLAVANVFVVDPTGAITIALANGSASGAYTPFTIRVLNSNHAITWPVGTKFPNTEPPALDGVTWVSGVVDDGGTLTVGASWSKVA